MIKTAIVGYGMSGACFHAPILRVSDCFEICAVVSSKPERVLADFPGMAVYGDLASMLAQRPDIELCVVCTPNELHARCARMSLKAGRHVVVEKPFVLSSQEGEALIRLAEAEQRVLTVFHSRRWDGDFLTLKALHDDGTLGVAHSFVSHYDRYRPTVLDRWRERDEPGAGILWDLGSHLVDQVLQLWGKPDGVTAAVARRRCGADAVDNSQISLEYRNRRALLNGDMLTCESGPRFQVHGSEGSLVKYGMDPQETYLRRKMGPAAPGWGLDSPENHATLTVSRNGRIVRESIPTQKGCYERFYSELAHAIRHHASPPVSARSALDVVRVLEAALLSAGERRTVAV